MKTFIFLLILGSVLWIEEARISELPNVKVVEVMPDSAEFTCMKCKHRQMHDLFIHKPNTKPNE